MINSSPETFTYDTASHHLLQTVNGGTRNYAYDANGNRLTKTINSFPETYTYDTVSHHLLQTVNGGTRNYAYDANGNTTDNTDRQFTYGNNNRLKEAQIAGSPIATYIYNGRGERVKKTGADTTLYFYDQNGQLIAELDATGNTLREYVYVDGMPSAHTTGGNVHFIHTDHLGTPQVITNNNQAIVWQADYTPFGSVNITTETVTNNLRAPGQYWDAETNLHYNGARDYSTEIGRYIESDSIGLLGGLNTYAYVRSNPISLFDPDGRAPTGGNQDPAGACSYYDQVCQASGGKCFYHCKTAPIICRSPYLVPTLWGVSQQKINCIRVCLIDEDKKAWPDPANKTGDCPSCLKDDVIDNYHKSCYTKCGVDPRRYPGVGPLGNE